MLITFGHGTLAAEDFARLLGGAAVEELVDVRSYPGSRRNPRFNREAMAEWLDMRYRWEPALGGRRRATSPSRNIALRNDSFRAYADHMADSDFRDALAAVCDQAAGSTIAVMCSESVWWRCHRRLIADAACLLHGTGVRHLFHDGRLAPHRPSPEARVGRIDGIDTLVYDVHGQLSLGSEQLP